ncbi:SFXN2 [Mytilus edulis]|uniref:SFXN2 n=1 Tax=Mytilus edulis TaxID=6550 RepID=A0A8S3UXX4_MYTED|nr:SFXN2 [Mytilus edulis]
MPNIWPSDIKVYSKPNTLKNFTLKPEMVEVDLDTPIWDQNTFSGRRKYYAWMTDPRNSLVSSGTLFQARDLIHAVRQNNIPSGTTVKDIRRAQQLYLSAFHPDTGELQNVIGRMSFQVPGGMVLIGAMITWYRGTSSVIFWQWANQSFNALVNYTNRNAASELTTSQIVTAYVSATTSALVTALGLKSLLANTRSPILQRFVPFAAVAASNAVNVPLMRQSEFAHGVTMFDEKNNKVTESRLKSLPFSPTEETLQQYAAVKGISQVVLSRILIAAPSMSMYNYKPIDQKYWLYSIE